MKILTNKIFTLAIIIILAFLFTNCNEDDSNPTSAPGQDSELVGTWDLVEVYIPIADSTVNPQDLGFALSANFKADGNYELSEFNNSNTPDIETGTWSTANGTLSLKNSDDGAVEIIPYSINGNVGTLKVNYEIQPGFEVPAEFKFMKQ